MCSLSQSKTCTDSSQKKIVKLKFKKSILCSDCNVS